MISFLALVPTFAIILQPTLPTAHTKRDIEGWTVQIDDRLLNETNKQVGDHALRILANRLYDIKHVVPADKVKQLQKVVQQEPDAHATRRRASCNWP